MKTLRSIILITSFVGLFGCATDLYSSSDDTGSIANYQSGELNGETIYAILAAELAGNQNNYDYSLDNYLRQAKLTNDPGIAKRAVRIAQHLRDTKRLIIAVNLWATAAPQEPEPHQILATLLLTQGKFSQALPHFNTALGLGQNKVLLLLTTQLNNMSATEIESYIKLLESATSQEGLDSDRYVTLGILQKHLKQSLPALQSFNTAIKLSTDSPSALYQKADTLKNLSRYKEALTTLEILLKDTSNDRQYNALQIQLLYLLKEDSQALAKTQLLLEKNPNDRPLHNYLALTALDFNHSMESKAIFLDLIISSPNISAPYFYLGIIAERDKQLTLAINNYLKVNNGSNVLQAHTRAISLHKKTSDRSKVEAITKQLIAKSSRDKTTYILMLADWLDKFEFTSDSIELLNQNIAQDPQNTDYLYARATYHEPTNFAAAEADFKKVLKLTPDNPVVLNALGYTLTIRTSRYLEALTLIEKALQLSPKDPATIDSMGWVLYKLKRYDEAVKYLSQAYTLYDDPEVASHLIAALASNKELKRANEILQKISDSHPDNKFVEQARKSLENPE
ncbi:MAG: tetratricopeptide repeat protein [Oceanospirillaceae bacterium]